MDTTESSAPIYRGSRRHPRGALRQSRASPHLQRGWVTIGQIALDPETGEEVEEYALYLCRRCNA